MTDQKPITWWPPVCDRCGKPLERAGAVFFGPPHGGVSVKFHIGQCCLDSFDEWRQVRERAAESDRDSWKQRAEEAIAPAESYKSDAEYNETANKNLRSELARVTEDRHKYLNRAAFAENELDRLVNGMGETFDDECLTDDNEEPDQKTAVDTAFRFFDELRKARRRVIELNTGADNIHADRVRLADSLREARSELARVAKVVDAAKRARNVRHPNLSHYGTRKVPGMPADLTIYDSGYDVRANELDLALWGAIDALASHDTGGGG